MKRPYLSEIELKNVSFTTDAQLFITMSEGQWDDLLAAGYDIGAILLELDDQEVPVRAFQRQISA